MDSVRFGRFLGSAAKALAGAVDAAAAPNPSPAKPRPAAPQPVSTPDSTPVSARPASSRPVAADPISTAARTAARATIQARNTGKDVARGGKRFGKSVWAPLVQLSGVLWLEITGAFFGIFALFAGQAAWTHKFDLYSITANHDDRIRAFVFLAMTLAFGYFCLSSFLRARRRERRG